MRKFYVYIHRRATDNTIFYVGKGMKQRAWYFIDRSEWWTRVHEKHGTIVEICQKDMLEDEAYLLEMWLIAKMRHLGIALVNSTIGGDAPPVHYGNNHPNYDHKIYSLVNIKTKEKFVGTQQEFRKIYKNSQGNVSMFLSGKFKSLKGWIKEGHDPKDIGNFGKNHHSYDETIYKFENLDGRTFVGDRYEFREFTGISPLQINAFIRGVNSVMHGWFFQDRRNNLPVGNVGKNNNHYDPTVYEFCHKDGRIFIGSGWEFRQKHGVSADGVFRLKTGKSKTTGGWMMKKNGLSDV